MEARKIRDIMTRNPEVVRPDDKLQTAAMKMRELDVGVVPVCDGRKLRGMLTDRDIAVRAVAEGQDPRSVTVQDVMTPDVTYCMEDDSLEEVARIMKEEQIRRLPIVDNNHDLVGIVSLGDLAVDTGDEQLSGRVLEHVSTPARPER
jgi:CBS domain-containing protein